MRRALVTGSGGLVGSEAVRALADRGFRVVGVDNDMRGRFFGERASTAPVTQRLRKEVAGFEAIDADIRDAAAIDSSFARHGPFDIIVHAAAQPSHDWAAREPLTDFGVNALGTLHLLEATRTRSPDATFVFTSTNKVYGDRPNALPLEELPTRWELPRGHPAWEGIDETTSVDATMHSVFGASKLAADAMVQEYGRYFGLNTVSFRGGCLTGPSHRGVELHGFLNHLVRCIVGGERYRIIGHKGKQVRDNIHTKDLVEAFLAFHERPRPGEVYNIGGGRAINCSVIEAIGRVEELAATRAVTEYVPEARKGDHVWYVSDTSKFRAHYPAWKPRHDLDAILRELVDAARSGA